MIPDGTRLELNRPAKAVGTPKRKTKKKGKKRTRKKKEDPSKASALAEGASPEGLHRRR